jgi:hypothetical protein
LPGKVVPEVRFRPRRDHAGLGEVALLRGQDLQLVVVEHAEHVVAVLVQVAEAARDVDALFIAPSLRGRMASAVMVVVCTERLVMKLITPPMASVP